MNSTPARERQTLDGSPRAAGNPDASSLLRRSRIAGLWYLLQGVTGPFYLLYIPSRFIVSGDAAATMARIAASETLFRLGIVAAFVCQAALLMTGLAFYRFLRPVDKDQARLLVSFVVASIPIGFLGAVFQIAALILSKGAPHLQAFEPRQLQSLAMVFLDIHQQGIYIDQIFWGLWLLPLGILVLKSGYFPRVFGFFLVAGFLGYLADSLAVFLFPDLRPSLSRLTTPAMAISEIPFLLWLLIRGARVRTPGNGGAPAPG